MLESLRAVRERMMMAILSAKCSCRTEKGEILLTLYNSPFDCEVITQAGSLASDRSPGTDKIWIGPVGVIIDAPAW